MIEGFATPGPGLGFPTSALGTVGRLVTTNLLSCVTENHSSSNDSLVTVGDKTSA